MIQGMSNINFSKLFCVSSVYCGSRIKRLSIESVGSTIADTVGVYLD